MRQWLNFRDLETRHGSVLEPVAKVFRELVANAPWVHRARRIRVDFDGSSVIADVPHGLGRTYTGGWIGDKSTVTRNFTLYDSETLVGFGVDPATHVRVRMDSSATTATVYVWVY